MKMLSFYSSMQFFTANPLFVNSSTLFVNSSTLFVNSSTLFVSWNRLFVDRNMHAILHFEIIVLQFKHSTSSKNPDEVCDALQCNLRRIGYTLSSCCRARVGKAVHSRVEYTVKKVNQASNGNIHLVTGKSLIEHRYFESPAAAFQTRKEK